MGILLEAIFGVCYFTIFSVCLVSVSNADSIFFTTSFDYTNPVIAMVWEASNMSSQNTSLIGLFYKEVGILLGGCLTCEELVGVTQRR